MCVPPISALGIYFATLGYFCNIFVDLRIINYHMGNVSFCLFAIIIYLCLYKNEAYETENTICLPR